MPFKSKAQRRKFAELLVKGEISPETYEEWNRETGRAKLPERVHPKAPRKTPRKAKAKRRKQSSNREEWMGVYYIGTYDITDPAEFQKYPPVVFSLLPKYGGKVLASDTSGYLLEGTKRTMNAIIHFPSREAALGLYNDPDYQEAKGIRQRSTANASMVIVEEFVMPVRPA